MPEPEITEKFIRVRIRNPKLFIIDTFRTIVIDDKKGIKTVIGKLKADPQGSTIKQSYLFNKESWDVEEAQKWVEEHGKGYEWDLNENALINLSEETEGGMTKMLPISKMYDCELKDFNEKERSFTAIASTEAVDRDGDILRANGWKLKNFKKNPVLLWGHNASMLPIGKAEKIWVDDGKLMFIPKFASAEANPFADQVFQMFKEGFLKAFSVRFDPIKWAEISPEEDKQNNVYRRGREYKSQELLEISAVNIPANPEALKSPAMQEFVVKSYLKENEKLLNPGEEIKFAIINNKNGEVEFTSDNENVNLSNGEYIIEVKQAELEELKEKKEKLILAKELDADIANLREVVKELEQDINEKKEKEMLDNVQKQFDIIKSGITRFDKK